MFQVIKMLPLVGGREREVEGWQQQTVAENFGWYPVIGEVTEIADASYNPPDVVYDGIIVYPLTTKGQSKDRFNLLINGVLDGGRVISVESKKILAEGSVDEIELRDLKVGETLAVYDPETDNDWVYFKIERIKE